MTGMVRRSGPLAGRTAELSALVTHVGSLAGDRAAASRLLILEGPSGIGKSRLVEEATATVSDRTRRLWIRCLDPDGERYRPLVSALEILRGNTHRSVDESLAFGSELLADLTDEVDRGLALVVIDDIQWADEGTLDVITRLLDALASDAVAPVMVATMRTGDTELPNALMPILRHPTSARLRLEGLGPREGAELLVALGAPLRLSDRFEELVALVDGTPLLLEEVASQLVRLADNDARVTDLVGLLQLIELPESVHADAERRIGEVDEDVRGLLRQIALLRDMPAERLQRLLGALHVVEVDELLDEAEDAGLLTVTRDAITLSHPSIRQALMRSMRRSARRRMHAAIADVMLSDLVADAREVSDDEAIELMHHVIHGQVAADERTIAVVRSARYAAVRRHDWFQVLRACGFLAECDALEPGHERGSALLDAGIAHFMVGEIDAAQQVLHTARAEMRSAGDLVGEVWASIALSRSIGGFQQLGASDNGVPFDDLLEQLGTKHPLLTAEIHADRAFSAWLEWDYVRSRALAETALELIDAPDLKGDAVSLNAQVRALTCLGLVDFSEGHAERSVEVFTDALALAEPSSDPLIALAPLARLPYALLAAGRVADAREAAASAMERLQALRFTGHMTLPSSAAVLGALLQCELGEAERQWRSLQQWATETGEVAATAAAGIALGVAHGTAGESDRAEERLRAVLGPVVDAEPLNDSPSGQPLFVWVRSENPARPVVPRQPPLPIEPGADLFTMSRAAVNVELARIAVSEIPSGVVESLELAVERGTVVCTVPPLLIDRSLGRALAMTGSPERARHHLDKALSIARTQRLPVEMARTMLDLIETGLAVGAERERLTDSLIDAIAQYRLVGLLERVEIADGRAAAELRVRLNRDRTPIEPGEAVVLMFDIVNSTGLTRELGDLRYREAARAVERHIRQGVAAAGGRTVEGVKLGDGALAEFRDVDQAVRAAIDVHRRVATGPLELRAGVNRGAVVREGSELFGSAINLAARTCDAADPGAVMVTAAAIDLLEGDWLIDLVDEGEFMMKGIDGPVRLYRPVAEAGAAVATV